MRLFIWNDSCLNIFLCLHKPTIFELKIVKNCAVFSANSFRVQFYSVKSSFENAPIKKCYFRANEAVFMNKVSKKAIMKKLQLRGVFLKRKEHLKVR